MRASVEVISTLAVGAIAATTYGVMWMSRHPDRKLRLEDVCMFALMCAGVVAGIWSFLYAFITACGDNGDRIPGTFLVYSGVLSFCIAIVSFAKAIHMIRVLRSSPKTVEAKNEAHGEVRDELPPHQSASAGDAGEKETARKKRES